MQDHSFLEKIGLRICGKYHN